jgi:hypothetical protein
MNVKLLREEVLFNIVDCRLHPLADGVVALADQVGELVVDLGYEEAARAALLSVARVGHAQFPSSKVFADLLLQCMCDRQKNCA